MSPSWTDFARSLKHKREGFTFDDFLVCLHIEDTHHFSQKYLKKSYSHSKAYLVESSIKPFSKSFKKHGFNKNKFGRKPSYSKNKNNAFNNKNKPKDKNLGNEVFCFVCGQANHLTKNCFQCHRQPIPLSLNLRYHVTSPKLNYIFNSNDWFIDSGANVHMCADKKLFSLYQESSTRTMRMRNESMTHVLGEGK